MKTYTFKVIIEEDPLDDGKKAYSAYCPALEGCFTWGYTFEETKDNIKEAIECYVESLILDGEPVPVEIIKIDKPEQDSQNETTVTVSISEEIAEQDNQSFKDHEDIQQESDNLDDEVNIVIPCVHEDDPIPPKTLERIIKHVGWTEEDLKRLGLIE